VQESSIQSADEEATNPNSLVIVPEMADQPKGAPKQRLTMMAGTNMDQRLILVSGGAKQAAGGVIHHRVVRIFIRILCRLLFF
jgi:hypothetical protein